MTILSVSLAVSIPLLCAAGGLGKLPLILTLQPPGCSAAALMLLSCYHHHYSSREARAKSRQKEGNNDCCPFPLSFYLAEIQTNAPSGEKCTDGGRERECMPTVHPAGSDSLQMFLRSLREGNHLCLWDNSWTLLQQHGSLKRLSVGCKGRKHESSGRPCSTSRHCITLMTGSFACEAQ